MNTGGSRSSHEASDSFGSLIRELFPDLDETESNAESVSAIQQTTMENNHGKRSKNRTPERAALIRELASRKNLPVDISAVNCHGKGKKEKQYILAHNFHRDVILNMMANFSMKEAALAVGVSATTLRIIARKHGLPRWINREANSKCNS